MGCWSKTFSKLCYLTNLSTKCTFKPAISVSLNFQSVTGTLWQHGLWSFQAEGTKFKRFVPKNQHTQRKLLNFENWVNGEVSKGAKIWLSKLIFYVRNYPNIFQPFFVKVYQFSGVFFFVIVVFLKLQFLKHFIY